MRLPAPNETWEFDTAHVGRLVHVYDELASTNTFALEFPVNRRIPEGMVILALQQTAGRGRYGRVWQSRPGSSLLMSVILDPPPHLRRPAILTAWAAVAIGDAIFKLTGLQARIKWPNDLLIRGKKVCGILIESGQRTIVGIGLNLNQTAAEFEQAALPAAASLKVLTDRDFELRDAAETVVKCLDFEYSRLLNGEQVAVEADWKWRIGLLGRDVIVEQTDGTTLTGRLREMSFDALEIEGEGPVPLQIPPESVAHITSSTNS